MSSELDYVPFSNQSTVDEDLKLSNILSETYGAFSVPDKDRVIDKFIDTITNTFFLKKNFIKYNLLMSVLINSVSIILKCFPQNFLIKRKYLLKRLKQIIFLG